MRKRWKLFTYALCAACITCACNNTPVETSNTVVTNPRDDYSHDKLNVLKPIAYSSVEGLTPEPGSYISIIGRFQGDSFWSEVEEGAKQAVKDLNESLGYKGEDKIQLSYVAPDERDDIDEQINILDEELDRYPIALGIAMIDAGACEVQFDLAAENGIPIIALDSGSIHQDVSSTCSTDNAKAAKTAATQMAAALNESGEVAIIVQDSKSMTALTREQAFVEELQASHPDIEVVAIYHMDELETMASTIAEQDNDTVEDDTVFIDPTTITQNDVICYLLEQYPNLKGIYATNLDTTQLVAETVHELERTDLKIIGFDGGEEQVALLEDGTLEGLILQNPYGMGYATVIAGVRASLGLANEATVDSGFTWVTLANLYDSSIEKMLY